MLTEFRVWRLARGNTDIADGMLGYYSKDTRGLVCCWSDQQSTNTSGSVLEWKMPKSSGLKLVPAAGLPELKPVGGIATGTTSASRPRTSAGIRPRGSKPSTPTPRASSQRDVKVPVIGTAPGCSVVVVVVCGAVVLTPTTACVSQCRRYLQEQEQEQGLVQGLELAPAPDALAVASRGRRRMMMTAVMPQQLEWKPRRPMQRPMQRMRQRMKLGQALGNSCSWMGHSACLSVALLLLASSMPPSPSRRGCG